MQIKCDYCGNFISDTDAVCPSCGGANDDLKRVANEVPTTIEELKQWYVDHKLPPEETTRFFIGKDYKQPKAFGIYKDEVADNIIVYKNLANGQRKIRYEGDDEAYAVNEIYQKLKEEAAKQLVNNPANRNRTQKTKSTPKISYPHRTPDVKVRNRYPSGIRVSERNTHNSFNMVNFVPFIIIVLAAIMILSIFSNMPSDWFSGGSYNNWPSNSNGGFHNDWDNSYNYYEDDDDEDNDDYWYWSDDSYDNDDSYDYWDDDDYDYWGDDDSYDYDDDWGYDDYDDDWGSSWDDDDWDSDWDSGYDWDSDYGDWDSDW